MDTDFAPALPALPDFWTIDRDVLESSAMGEPAGTLSISLFGHVSISSTRGRPAGIALPKASIALLTYVIVFRGETLRRDRIAYALWPDEPEAQARANLRRHLYVLSRALTGTPQPCLTVDARTVRWNADAGVHVDVIAFEAGIDAPATRAEALDYYNDDLALDVDAEWIDAPRAHLRTRFCAAAHDEARAALVAGDTGRATEIAERILALDPWREEAVRIVIECRASAGDRAGALAYYRDFCERLRAQIDAEPMPQTRELAGRLARAPDAPTPRTPLPAPLSRLIGRSREIAEIEAMLESARIVTITGPGGVGKTRLAAEIIARFTRENDAIAVSLIAAHDDRNSIERAVLEAFDVEPSEERAVDVLARIVGSRKMLLSLDNADRVIAATADFTRDLLRRTANLRVLVTSQQRLRLDGERVFALAALSVPGSVAGFEDIERSEAVQLFFDRAKAIDARFTLTPQVGPAIASICRRVDGLPLSLELAAGRTNVLTVPEIEERLADRFDFLRSSTFGQSEQHRTLRATLDWSFELLSERERAAFRAFAVFANGWTLAAATALARDAVDDLSGLIEKSLVVTHTTGPSRRYGYLESIRLYARERLDSAGERMELERRAFTYYAEFVATRSRQFSTRGEKAAFDEIAADHDNILALLDAAIASGAIEESATLAVQLTHFWVLRGFGSEGGRRLDLLLERDDALPVKARVDLRNAASRTHLWHGGIARASSLSSQALELAIAAGDESGEAEALCGRAKCAFTTQVFEESESWLESARALFARVSDRVGEARTLDLLGQFAAARGEPGASAYFRRSLSLYETVGDLRGIGVVTYHLGFAALARGEYDAAAALNTKAMDTWRDCGYVRGENWAQYNLAVAEFAMGRHVSAARLHLDCVRNAHRYGFRYELCNGLDRLADVLADRNPELALRCLAYAARSREQSGYAVLLTDRSGYDACMQRLRDRLSADAFASQWNLGGVAEESELIATLTGAIASDD